MARKSKDLPLKNSKYAEKKEKGCYSSIELNNSNRSPKSRILKNKIKIYCNALKTEFNYFKNLGKDVEESEIANIRVEVLKTQNKGGLDPYNAVKYVITNKDDCDEVWIIFDKDHFEIEEAIKLARANNINVAWSNECFELWFLFHFNRISVAMGRKDCLSKIEDLFKKNLKIKYEKNSDICYEKLKNSVKKAIAFAKAQHQEIERDKLPPSKSNPCTTVYKLVDFLLARKNI